MGERKPDISTTDLLPRLTNADWEMLAERIPDKTTKIMTSDTQGTKSIDVPFTLEEVNVIVAAMFANNRIKRRNRGVYLHHCKSESEWYYFNLYGGEAFPGFEDMVDRAGFVKKIRNSTKGLNINNQPSHSSDLRIISSLPRNLIAANAGKPPVKLG